ncbi:MAG: Unknown protein [uncultured Campylobacterales bacterium]|uniref:Uncharacterized protein n=1 Tax=uncultured Campylobacterales bacterium TaxID=352960 RepID=A0A6S6T0Y3_9BACT|nr:MAG: Unknown protein [uncultured Campylobacterales bacterium]
MVNFVKLENKLGWKADKDFLGIVKIINWNLGKYNG